MARKGYIPGRDGDFNSWQNNFVSYVITNAAALGITPAEVTELQNAQTSWNSSFPASITAKNASKGANELKDEDRDTLESTARLLTRKVQARKETTDTQREGLGITVPDMDPTALSEDVVLNTTPPMVHIDHSKPRMAFVHFGANPQNEKENAKPDGIKGARIWYHMGGLPTGGAKWEFLADDTNSPYNHIINNDIGITVAYRAQWFDNRLRLGPLGDPITVAISP